MIKDDLALLYKLQCADSAIDEREALLAEIDDGTTAGEVLAAAQTALDEAEEELRLQQSHHRDLELQLKTIDEEKKEKSEQAFGGTEGDPKTLASLVAKLEELERNTSRVEDQTLETLEAIEAAQAVVDECTEARDAARAVHLEVTATYDRETQKAETELEGLRAERAEIAPGVPPAMLKTYDQMRGRLQGVAIVALSGSMCTSCKVTVPSVTVMRIGRGKEVLTCENCRRMLHVPED